MYTPRVLAFDSPRKRQRTETGYVVVTPSPRSVELRRKTPMSKYTVVRKLAGRAWRSKYGKSLRSRARAKGSRYLKRAGRRGLKKFKSRRGLLARGMAKVGHPEGMEPNKHYPIAVDLATNNLNPYSILSQNLIVVPQQTAGAPEQNRREGKQIDVKGIRYKSYFKNNDAAKAKVLHMAIIIPKAENYNETAIPAAEFFRNDDADRGIGLDVSNSSMIHNTRPINTDLYHVLWRKTIRLSIPSGEVEREGKHIRLFQKYIPINRQFRFVPSGGSEATSSNDPYFVTWYDDQIRNATVAGTAAAVARQQEIYLVFRDVQ